ncbi:lipid II:glycine glycyltransferase FemX [Mangrovivirga cuniculi]|uniref:Peptidoglycan bridge formation protein FemAB n=1 Tax=Mangrovivirga cuniculi TaxID=2715131 RepID=A0A4D7JSJ1_9BACT|nr:peptidoglycan bridge formation glycyltransferase FemA/FemB family protein [Mangrovivirga cuniculi]QCK15652.1 peptidoglycan bridge formation protein FemAB [Mangrovivirga cuniculi]
MNCRVVKKDINDLKPTNVLPQTSFWGKVKNDQGFLPAGFELTVSKDLINSLEENITYTNDDLLILIKYLDADHCFAYVPYGPKIEPEFENHGTFLEELSEIIKDHLPSNCVFIRYDLLWQNQWSQEEDYYDENGNWTGPPSEYIQEMRLNYNTQNWNLRKSPGDILPMNTFFLDLKKDNDELLRGMRYHTRNRIKKAGKKGIEVREYGSERIDDWFKLYTETAIRSNLPQQNPAYFEQIWKKQDESQQGVKVKLLMAEHEGNPLSSMFLALSKKRGTYLFGASTAMQNQMPASYALQWKAIQIAKEHGCSEYDMFGSAPNLDQSHPLSGVHRFKKGFGGELYHRMGCWDYVFDQSSYQSVRIVESSQKN